MSKTEEYYERLKESRVKTRSGATFHKKDIRQICNNMTDTKITCTVLYKHKSGQFLFYNATPWENERSDWEIVTDEDALYFVLRYMDSDDLPEAAIFF